MNQQPLGRGPRVQEPGSYVNCEPRGSTEQRAREPGSRNKTASPRRKRAIRSLAWILFGFWRRGLMDSTKTEADDDEQPLARVRLSRGIYMGEYEMT